ncbi:MAG: alkyl hydroperoxide reductase [Phormidesmis sp. CAN_BIN36]|nr:alkyl hydroperoxide reductase [Phormidesmis sp. CAN_BIN36]
MFEQGGHPLPRCNGNQSFELAIPATFVVNQDGKIIYAFASADYTERADPAEVVTTLRKIIPQPDRHLLNSFSDT